MLSQVKRPDYWLLGFDGERREAAEQVLAAVRGHDWIVPVWQRRSGGVHEHPSRLFDREVWERIGEHYIHIVTARLDNDDAINRWFLHDLHQYSAALLAKQPALEDFWVSFPTGVHILLANADCSIIRAITSSPELWAPGGSDRRPI